MIRGLMHRILFFVFSAFTLAGCSKETMKPLYPSESAEGFNFRQGLPNFFNKIKSGQEVTVAYFGGSITEARNGWRDMTFNWLDSIYPKSSFKQIDATIGGTGSDLGVFRMDQEVLSYHPDLIFVEFASNDTGTPETIYKTMEGIVRKTWQKYPNTDLCFVYTLIESNIEAMKGGSYQPTALAMEKIAEHYGIPSIHMGIPVMNLLDSGKLVFKGNPSDYPGKIVFTKDGTHPQSSEGHAIYAQAVIKAFGRLKDFAMEKPHYAATPYIQDNWETAQMISLSDIAVKNDWEKLPASDPLSIQFVKNMPELYKAKVPGASFTVKFNGKILGMYDLVGPASGIVDVIIDGKPAIDIYRFDSWAYYYRAHNFFLKELPEGDHEVKFVVTGKQFDKAAILLKNDITITNPELYKENSWFVGKIMVVGKSLQ